MEHLTFPNLSSAAFIPKPLAMQLGRLPLLLPRGQLIPGGLQTCRLASDATQSLRMIHAERVHGHGPLG